MKILSSVGIGLSVVFCWLLLALFAEAYYLLWWKRRITAGTDQIQHDKENQEKKRPPPLMPTTQSSHELRMTEDNNVIAHQSETGFGFYTNNIDLYLKAIDENCMVGPPRFLFTIKEETREDLEVEEGRVKAVSRRLSDLMRNEDDTPLLTTSVEYSHSRSSSIGTYNPFHESSTDVEFNLMTSSPPTKFKFLRDAEEKLWKKNAFR